MLQVVGFGSVGRCTTFDTVNKMVICGCFYGNYKDFEEKVRKEYDEKSIYRKQYLSALEMVKSVDLKNEKED